MSRRSTPIRIVSTILYSVAILLLCLGLYGLFEWLFAGVSDYVRGAWFGSTATSVWVVGEAVYRRVMARADRKHEQAERLRNIEG